MGFVIGFLYFLFILSSLVLIMIILVQEGKGGGFAEAFSGVGGETFGVKATGLHKFTGAVAGVFVGSAVLVSLLRGHVSVLPAAPPPAIPSSDNPGGTPNPNGGQNPPSTPGGGQSPSGQNTPQTPQTPEKDH
ncbi:MAG: preprotein translocase subunit SecG [Planctomycetes bacterium]|nr:preprotein translocase subunit SecG [Planctomycetota bacterium]MBI3844890.1 preprotein translocase subunit SecG [Planctomycetota bacterium]